MSYLFLVMNICLNWYSAILEDLTSILHIVVLINFVYVEVANTSLPKIIVFNFGKSRINKKQNSHQTIEN